ncbi:MAG: hypothetical protein LBO63_05295, partial [Oscillospiraceae bacterium]|nr:hypothetical protein [Oscillospiraceae bacterium]
MTTTKNQPHFLRRAALLLPILALALAFAFFATPQKAAAAADVDGNPHYYFDGTTGTLTIKTNDATDSGSPYRWYENPALDTTAEQDDILHIVIAEGVTDIGTSAFFQLDSVTDI